MERIKPVEIGKGIYWVGAVDWNIRHFHGHTFMTHRGTTYNAYLIVDEKIALVDTVHAPFTQELVAAVRQIVDPKDISYIIANHVETDHSGALPSVCSLAPKATVVGTQKCKEGLAKHYRGTWDFKVVKSLDTISLGKRTLNFLEAPMLHWPDSMFTYIPEEKILMPNDAFGQHYASSERFDDEVDQAVLMEEAATYYANILWPLSTLVAKKLDDVRKMNLAVSMIAPSHGIIWRKNPGMILEAYARWAGQATQPKAVIVYETMWQATAAMARTIAQGLTDQGISVRLFDITQSDPTTVLKEMLDARGFAFGSSTHDNGMLPTMSGFLSHLKAIRPRNRVACVFGSYGWAGGAVKEIEQLLAHCSIPLGSPSCSIQYTPDETELGRCYEAACLFGQKILQSP